MKPLSKIARKYNTDKGVSSTWDWSHGYTEFYDRYFSAYDNPVIFEIGVYKGESIRLYDAYYGGCEIYCADIEDMSGMFANMPNVHFYQLDQSNRDDWDRFNKMTEGVEFDIILDDGGHQFDQQMISLSKLHRRVRKNGIYILEDLHTSLANGVSYSPLMFLNYFGVKHPSINHYLTDEEFNDLCDDIRDVVISNAKSVGDNQFYHNRSITSVITFNH